MRHASFAPVVDAATRTLILGSLPGAASLAAGRYYANPRNQFWRLVGDTFGLSLTSCSYDERLTVMRQRGIGLWDVVADAERHGSLDAAIRNPAANDLRQLMASLPNLDTIAFNGKAASKIGTASLGLAANQYRCLTLPSSSPALTMAYERKLEAWRTLAA